MGSMIWMSTTDSNTLKPQIYLHKNFDPFLSNSEGNKNFEDEEYDLKKRNQEKLVAKLTRSIKNYDLDMKMLNDRQNQRKQDVSIRSTLKVFKSRELSAAASAFEP